ncbi:Glycoprotein-N-acetylgalactosamine 3-beta-galactosyltransferase 1 [Fasciola gigantica]|uniref:N-acetylgalactosaminide beta-1,3-galactosyltransferase n=1 Tax=Fasciola gigantica TaxID=46835 RepID=A0A504YFW0_FASGI|nr:Glycoprotein-N-acetylgalactosamine 3-beta-galactosyltransferase 1 [Fasciola gigantica]
MCPKLREKPHDFFLKADDDTYVIMENLEKLLANMNSSEPFLMGRHFRLPRNRLDYLSGGGGYVMSREALLRIVHGIKTKPACGGSSRGGAEDVNVGLCAKSVGVNVLESLDEFGLERFHPFDPRRMFSPETLKSIPWFYNFSYHKAVTGSKCCSIYSISFHYVSPVDMYVIDYFLYEMRVHGQRPREIESETNGVRVQVRQNKQHTRK